MIQHLNVEQQYSQVYTQDLALSSKGKRLPIKTIVGISQAIHPKKPKPIAFHKINETLSIRLIPNLYLYYPIPQNYHLQTISFLTNVPGKIVL